MITRLQAMVTMLTAASALATTDALWIQNAIDTFEIGGVLCSTPHCIHHDDSFQNILPLQPLETVQRIPDATALTLSTSSQRFETTSQVASFSLLAALRATKTAHGLISNGFLIKVGSILWPHGCPPGAPKCVLNPITQYGRALLEGDPAETIFELDGDDAFIIYGFTPPAITYYGFTMYQVSRYNPETHTYFDTRSSIGLNVNQVTINTTANSFFALIVAANYRVADAVGQSLREVGVPKSAINRMLVPREMANRGHQFPDRLAFVIRLARRNGEEVQAVEDYIAETPPNMQLIFFDGPGSPGDVEEEDLPKWEDTLRSNTSELETGADKDLEILVSRIVSQHQAEGYILKAMGTQSFFHMDSERCRSSFKDCLWGNADVLYAHFVCQNLEVKGEPQLCVATLPNTNDFLVVAGVDHHRYADDTLLTYFMHAVKRFDVENDDFSDAASFTDLEVVGSAATYLDGTTVNDENLYAMKISRKCGDLRNCVELPWGFEGGIPQFGLFYVNTWNYLDKVTGSGPNAANLIPARLLWFGR